MYCRQCDALVKRESYINSTNHVCWVSRAPASATRECYGCRGDLGIASCLVARRVWNSHCAHFHASEQCGTGSAAADAESDTAMQVDPDPAGGEEEGDFVPTPLVAGDLSWSVRPQQRFELENLNTTEELVNTKMVRVGPFNAADMDFMFDRGDFGNVQKLEFRSTRCGPWFLFDDLDADNPFGVGTPLDFEPCESDSESSDEDGAIGGGDTIPEPKLLTPQTFANKKTRDQSLRQLITKDRNLMLLSSGPTKRDGAPFGSPACLFLNVFPVKKVERAW